jgi:deaminated glutathione amidase
MPVPVAVAQFHATTEKEANLKATRDLVEAAAQRGARLVVTPECSMYGWSDDPDEPRAISEPLTGHFAEKLSALAAESGAMLVAGLIEQSGDGREQPFNTVVAYAADGTMLGCYRKLHLYDAFGYLESARFRSGPHAAPLIFDLDDLRFGVMTCYDLRFPEMARLLVDAGAHALIVPAAWVAGPAKEDHWITLLRARAIENSCYVVAAGQTSPRYIGRSAVIDPMGTVQAGAGEEPAIALAELTSERVQRVRGMLPGLTHRRFHIEPD